MPGAVVVGLQWGDEGKGKVVDYFAGHADLVVRFVYLRSGLSAVLVYVGVKMLVVRWVKVPPAVSLGVVLGILTLAVFASWLSAARTRKVEPGQDDDVNSPP